MSTNYMALKANNETQYREWAYDVPIEKITATPSVLDGKNVGRVMSGRMIRDIIGTYVNYKVVIFRGNDQTKFDELVAWLLRHSVDDSIMARLAWGQNHIEAEMYYTIGDIELEDATDDVNKWKGCTISFIMMQPYITP